MNLLILLLLMLLSQAPVAAEQEHNPQFINVSRRRQCNARPEPSPRLLTLSAKKCLTGDNPSSSFPRNSHSQPGPVPIPAMSLGGGLSGLSSDQHC